MNQFMNGALAYRRSPAIGKLFIGVGATLLISALWKFKLSSEAQRQIDFRKTRLALPIYRLSEQQMINPPWNQHNIKDWLYRRVEVSGRPIHRLTCMVPRKEFQVNGFQYVVPLLVKEEKDRSNPQGLILSKGWIPPQWKNPNMRYKLENVQKQTFIGFVSQLDQLKSSLFSFPNSPDRKGKEATYNYADMKDFVHTAGFVNKKQAGVALVEMLHQEGPLDQRNPQRRNNDASFSVDYPYIKNYSGALQLAKMPWDYTNEAKNCLVGSIASFVVGASLF